MTAEQTIAKYVFGLRPCGCHVGQRHKRGCAELSRQRREARLKRITELKAEMKPTKPPTRYKVPPRPERPSTELPVGWMPEAPARGLGFRAAKKEVGR